MKKGDLVRIRTGLADEGMIGLLLENESRRWCSVYVAFFDGVCAILPESLEVINEHWLAVINEEG